MENTEIILIDDAKGYLDFESFFEKLINKLK